MYYVVSGSQMFWWIARLKTGRCLKAVHERARARSQQRMTTEERNHTNRDTPVWIKGELYIWRKHQANPHHQSRKNGR